MADELEIVARWMKQARSFRETMRDAGIHVGIGDPPTCAVDDEPWPCAQERSDG